ncbi:MAG: phage major capsid protein [Gallionellaceae bacterium]|nr:phage major capsid protein [Gallionellaceae bacterium]
MNHARSRPLGLSTNEIGRYSILRAINAVANKDWKNAGFERETHLAMQRVHGESEREGSFYIPTDLLATRDLTAGVGTGGGYLVGTNNLGGSFIDQLRNRMVCAQMGATVLPGLQGNVTVPKQTGANTAYWLATETTAVTEGNLTLGQMSLTPKSVGAYQEISRQLMLQSNPAADALVMNDLAKVVALAIDAAALSGTGASGQPTGITNTAGIGAVIGTNLQYAGILEFQTDVAGSNALISGDTVGYVSTPSVAGLLAQRQRFTSTDSPLWQGTLYEGMMAGCKAMSSAQMAAGTMLFGDWSQLVIGEWGVLEIAVNPFTNFQAGIIGVRAIQTVDVGIRVPGAFSLATSIT